MRDEAFDKTYELAKKSAEDYRKNNAELQTKLLGSLLTEFDQFSAEKSPERIEENLRSCVESNVLGEGDINMLGYEQLMRHKKIDVALSIFKANTHIFPNSANVYDSYAEALLENGKKDEAIKNYKKAVAVAKANNSKQLKFFEQNLKAAHENTAEKK